MPVPHFVLVVALAVFGCSSGTSVSPEATSGGPDPTAGTAGTSLSDVVELRYDETVSYQDLRIRWLELADSRCPIGVTCVWAGQMLANVEVEHRTQGSTTVELLRRAGREPEVSFAFGYELRLLNVEPHPKDGITPDRGDYVMSVQITQP